MERKFKYMDPKWIGSNALKSSLSIKKAKVVFPKLFNIFGFRKKFSANKIDYLTLFDEMLWQTAVGPAIVIQLNPCIIACYADDLDGVVILEYNQQVVNKFNLQIGERLLTLNSYGINSQYVDKDFISEINKVSFFKSVTCIIADFITDDNLIDHKAKIPENEWIRLNILGKLINKTYPERKREVLKNGKIIKPNNCEIVRFKNEFDVYNLIVQQNTDLDERHV